MSRNLETRLAKLEAARAPMTGAVVQILFAQTDHIAERIAKGTATAPDRFVVVSFVEAVDGKPAPDTKHYDPLWRDGHPVSEGARKPFTELMYYSRTELAQAKVCQLDASAR